VTVSHGPDAAITTRRPDDVELTDATRGRLEAAHETASHPDRDAIWATACAAAGRRTEAFVAHAYAEILWDLEHRDR